MVDIRWNEEKVHNNDDTVSRHQLKIRVGTRKRLEHGESLWGTKLCRIMKC